MATQITVAFTPYEPSSNAGAHTRAATRPAESPLLQVGMKQSTFPTTIRGRRPSCSPSNTAELNIDRLHWFLSRFQGYVGITSLMGARFTATEQALQPRAARGHGKRGLNLFRRRVSSPRSGSPDKLRATKMSRSARADAVLDAVPTGERHRQRAESRLVSVARSRDVGIASASELQVTIDRIANWARSAEAPRVTLVPVSAVANRAKTSS